MNRSLEEIKALVIDRIEEYLLYLLPGGEFYIGAVVLKVNRKNEKISPSGLVYSEFMKRFINIREAKCY